MQKAEGLSAHTRILLPVRVGDGIRIQNQMNPTANNRDKTGILIEIRQFDQYFVRVDGSGHVTLRNRTFLRKYLPVILRHPVAMLPKAQFSLHHKANS